MPTPFTILIKSDDGKVNEAAVNKLFDGLKPGRYELSAKGLNKRSNQANRYYWGYLIVEAQRGFRDIGHDLSKEEVHEFFKSRFNYQEIVNEQTGEIISLPRSTANLPKDEFSEYIGKIQQFCAEWLNVVILDPNQQTAIWQ